MGRWTTGAIITEEAVRIELSYLIKNRILQKGFYCKRILSWNNGSSLIIDASYLDDDFPYIQLSYQSTNDDTGEKEDFNYKIQLDRVPSNLGQGSVLYFICPVTRERCRILYKCYGSKIWKSREAYNIRIYYSCQISSKKGYYNDRYWRIEKKLDQIPRPVKKHYKGAPTRLQSRIKQLEQQLSHYDDMSFQVLENELCKWDLGPK